MNTLIGKFDKNGNLILSDIGMKVISKRLAGESVSVTFEKIENKPSVKMCVYYKKNIIKSMTDAFRELGCHYSDSIVEELMSQESPYLCGRKFNDVDLNTCRLHILFCIQYAAENLDCIIYDTNVVIR